MDGIEALDKALAAGINTPEVITLVNREKKLAELAKDRPERLFVAIRRYLANQEIPVELRQSVMKELKSRWSRFHSLDEADLTRGMDESPVSVRGLMQASREQMDAWLKRLPPAADPGRAAKIKTQIEGLKSTADEASKMLDGMADAQGQILLILAESVFPEEQEAKGDRDVAWARRSVTESGFRIIGSSSSFVRAPPCRPSSPGGTSQIAGRPPISRSRSTPGRARPSRLSAAWATSRIGPLEPRPVEPYQIEIVFTLDAASHPSVSASGGDGSVARGSLPGERRRQAIDRSGGVTAVPALDPFGLNPAQPAACAGLGPGRLPELQDGVPGEIHRGRQACNVPEM